MVREDGKAENENEEEESEVFDDFSEASLACCLSLPIPMVSCNQVRVTLLEKKELL